MADKFYKRSGIFDEDRSGFAFREVFTPTREGPLPPRPKAHRSGVGGGPQTPAVVTTSVWSASDAAASGMTLSNGGLTATATIANWNAIRGTIGKSTGKLYFEVANGVLATSQFAGVGFASAAFVPSNGTYLGEGGPSGAAYLFGSQFINAGAFNYGFPATTANAGDVLSVAIDLDANKGWISYNGAWEGGGNPATGASPAFTMVVRSERTTAAIFPAMAFYSTGGVWTLQSTDASLKYRPPPGFQAWDGGPVTPTTSVWSAADAAANGMTLSNGGLTVTPSGAASWQSIRSSVGKTSGKLYIEFSTSVAVDSLNEIFGFASSGFVPIGLLGSSNYSVGAPINGAAVQASSGFVGGGSVGFSSTPAINDVFMLAIDFTAGNLWFGHNNAWLGTGGSNPATGASPISTFVPTTVGALFAGLSFNHDIGSNGVWTLQATPSSQKYLPPPGFQAWDGGPVTPTTSVWSASDATANGMTLSNGGLTVTSAVGGGYQTVRGTISQTSGKLYIEFNMSGGSVDGVVGDPEFGIATSGFSPLDYIGHNPISAGSFSGASGSLTPVNPTADFTANYIIGGNFPALNDVWAIAVDLTAGKYWVAKNNVWIGSGNPATGANPMISIVGAGLGQAYFPAMALRNGPSSTGVWTLQPTAASQKYAPPAGFTPWG